MYIHVYILIYIYIYLWIPDKVMQNGQWRHILGFSLAKPMWLFDWASYNLSSRRHGNWNFPVRWRLNNGNINSTWFMFTCHDWLPQKTSLPSGKHTKNYGKSPLYSWVNKLFVWPFSIISYVENYQRVIISELFDLRSDVSTTGWIQGTFGSTWLPECSTRMVPCSTSHLSFGGFECTGCARNPGYSNI